MTAPAVAPPRRYSTSWLRGSETGQVHLGFDDLTAIMELVWSTMDALPPGTGTTAAGLALDALIEHLAAIREWTVPGHRA